MQSNDAKAGLLDTTGIGAGIAIVNYNARAARQKELFVVCCRSVVQLFSCSVAQAARCQSQKKLSQHQASKSSVTCVLVRTNQSPGDALDWRRWVTFKAVYLPLSSLLHSQYS